MWPQLALLAVGISCGAMLFDTVYALCHSSLRSRPLIIGHHALSVAFFPYATLQHRALLLVLFFVITDVTNVGQRLQLVACNV